ncbi:SusC/RagA family TonB-linked outer membrane protein [Sphingobacterium sp. FBM7-1]|uniref:SusC/RagA family TonB-linked outer membrane protein n=1 Tax=Sphingobacterium sp. FBM7-1 TaxID=2886688 RepID=UPI001D1122D6|nr:TonB-dependent receptor [Sphingobacterium sp. FBM7-1]MCC2599407.1 TonB-dependent receptor [Sphingobacterium sp. FBM7-1]
MRYPIIILLLLSSLYTMAQSISGKITNEIGQPIANVTISHLETGTASVSDSSGRYTVALKNTVGRLNFSAIGYAQKEVQLTGSSNIDVVLQEDFVNLNEVVVIGYGSMDKKDLTGAVSTLSGEKLENINGTQLSQELQGQIPGVTVTRSSSRPGASADIRIRGVTTIGDSSPLIIVDGVPYNNIDDISSEDIKDITVLKDAASASIYGSRAAAGVILITTKNAPAGTTSLEAGLNMGLERIPTFPRSVGATRYLQMSNEAMWNDAGNPEGAEYPLYSQQDVENWETYHLTDPNNYPVTDWIDLLIKDRAPRQRHFLNFSHGGEKVNSRVSLNYEDTDALFENSNYERVMVRANNQIRFNNRLKANVDINLNRSVNNNPTSNPINSAHKYAPIYAATWTDGRIAGGKDGSNMYADILYGGFDKNTNSKVNGRISMEYEPIDGLTLTGTLSPSYHFQKGKNFIAKLPWYDAEDPTILGGYISGHNKTNLYESRAEVSTLTKQFIVNYAKRFHGHNMSVMGGYEDFTYDKESLDAQSEDFELSNFHYLNLGNRNSMFNTGNAVASAYRSVFGRLLYDYESRYYLQANFRYDGSSRFHPDHRWALFPSVSVGWSISEESFMEDVEGVSILKLRGSYGTLGNERIGYYPYQSSIGFSSTPFYQGDNIISKTTAAQVGYAIQDISWETTASWNIGLDGGFLGNRLSVSADYYVKRTRDMLLELEVPDYLGYENPDQNTGTMKTNGWEFVANWSDRIGDDFRYSASFNLSDFISNMGFLGGTVFTGDQIIREGSQYNEWFGYISDGLFQNTQEVENSALLHSAVKPGDVRYRDISGPDGVPDGVITPEYDKVLLGGSLPRFTYGGNLTVGYKAFDLSVVVQGVGKQTSRLAPNMIQPFESTWTSPSTLYDGNYWSVNNSEEENRNARFPRLSHQSAKNNNYEMSDFWLFDGSYFRLKNVTIGYNLPESLLSRINMKGARIYMSGTDLFALSDYPKGYDPEALNNSYISSTYSLGLNIKF